MEWEILSFRIKTSGSILYKKRDGWYGFSDNAAIYPIEEILKSDDHEIYSVSRLTDNEEFTIGDKYNILGSVGWIIREFFMSKNNCCYVKDISGHETSSIFDIKKLKKSVFICESQKQ